MAPGADTSGIFSTRTTATGRFPIFPVRSGSTFWKMAGRSPWRTSIIDGRQEVFLKNRNGPQLRVLKNVMEDLPPSIAFRLRGVEEQSRRDRRGSHSRIGNWVVRPGMLQAGSGFLSQHSKDVFFGLGKAKGSVQASIRWPSGVIQKLRDLPVNHRVWVEEGSEQFGPNPSKLNPRRHSVIQSTGKASGNRTSPHHR